MVQAILFDADGVLINASELHFQAFNQALATKGWCLSRAQHSASFNGLGTRDKLNLLTESLGFPESWHQEVVEAKFQFTQDAIRKYLEPDLSKIALLEAIVFEGIAVGVCSNMQQVNLELTLEQAGLAPYVEAIIGYELVTNHKPSPDTYFAAAAALGTDISLCTVVVDNSISLAAAQAADPLDIVMVSGPEEVNLDLRRELLRYALPNRNSA